MNALPKPLRIGLIILGALLIVFMFLAFIPPLVPISRVDIVGQTKIPKPKIEEYLQTKKFIGLLPTSAATFEDASEKLGPLLEKLIVKQHFFFAASVEVVEKPDIFGIAINAGAVFVDIEGNIIESSTPTSSSKIFLELAYKTPTGFDMIDLKQPLEENIYTNQLQPLVAAFLKLRDKISFTFKRAYFNTSGWITFQHQNKTCLLAPTNFNHKEIDDLPKTFTRAYLDDIQGLFVETVQGSLIALGAAKDLDVKFATLIQLTRIEDFDKKGIPAIFKLDIPYQVTTTPWFTKKQ